MAYSKSELDDIQERWQLRFPPDLIELWQRHRCLAGPRSFDWLLDSPATIKSLLDWPFEGFWFDVENNRVWWPEWGERPTEVRERRDRLREIFAQAPKLIPLFGHRYIPEQPFEHGNPVFSVHQTDVVHYGTDLQDWLDRERHGWYAKPWPSGENIKVIPFWSEAVARNGRGPDD